MVIVFRTDASLQIGTGHVMRCLALADALRDRGALCRFVSRAHPGNLLALIARRGHEAVALPTLTPSDLPEPAENTYTDWLGTSQLDDAADTAAALGLTVVDWLVVDHYAIDITWEQALSARCNRLMVIDDLADRGHDCDLLLDQNLGRTQDDYVMWLAARVPTLVGPHYALLRPQFGQLRAASLQRRAAPRLEHILVTLGGVDHNNITTLVLDALVDCKLSSVLMISVVMGPHAPWLQQVQEQAARMARPVRVLAGVDNMAQLMAECDFAIGAAGSTSWERCCLAMPTLQLVLADNQREAAAALYELGAVESLEIDALRQQLPTLLDALGPERLSLLSQRAALVCDGQGAPRVAEAMLQRHDCIKKAV